MQNNSLQKQTGAKLLAVFALILAFFLAGGITVYAEEYRKQAPMENLAKGAVEIKDSNNNKLENEKKLIDGDKYYLQHAGNPSRIEGNGQSVRKVWETYKEQSATASKGAEWIQIDLGASYPIEVINLKRRMYDTSNQGVANDDTMNDRNKLNYKETTIVIGNDADLRDGYVVTYNGNTQLPAGVEIPAESVQKDCKENLGGSWFYMDNKLDNGRGYTDPGVTKTARYIRVYSDAPDHTEQMQFMELAVYGYRDVHKVQKYHKRQEINNKSPLMIATAYSSDTYSIGQKEKVGLQGYNTIGGRWNAVPKDLQPYTVLMMHNNNLGGKATPHHVGQALMQDYYEACLQESYAVDAATMLMTVNASAVPGGSDWCITRSLDYNWVDLMYRMYPNMEGVFSTENFWSGAPVPVAKTLAELLEIAHRHGGYLVYSDADHNNYYDQIFSVKEFREAVQKYGDSYFMTYKNTQGSPDSLHSNSSLIGSWLSGYIGGWGMLSDTWAWGNSGNGDLWKHGAGNKNWQSVCGEPEAIFGIQMLQTYLSGGVVYTFEFPEVVYGAIDQNSPAYSHVVEQVYRYICTHPAPSRADVLKRNKVILYGDASSLTLKNTVGTDNAMNMMQNGRYGGLPTIPNWGSEEEVTAHLKETARKEGAASPVVMNHDSPLVNYGAKDYFNKMYPRTYLGDAFAEQYQGAWYIFNNVINDNIRQTATIPLKAADGTARFTAELDPHAFFIMNENDESIAISFNNYRVDKTDLVFKNTENWAWNGSSATGQGVSPAKLTIYRYMAYYNVVNGKKGVPNLDTPDKPNDTIDQRPPVDNALRTSTFKINNLLEEPTVKIVKGQAPDTQDSQPQYKEHPIVVYNKDTKTATITIETNGWVDLQIENLKFEKNDNAIPIEDPKPEEGPQYGDTENLAAGKTVTASHGPSTGGGGNARPLSWAVDGKKSTNDYTDPGSNQGGPVWIQVDLGGQQKVESVNLRRYFQDNRKYFNTVVLLSSTSDFEPDSTLVLWNANSAQTGRNGKEVKTWTGPINGQAGNTHTLPTGTDALYSETSNGKTFPVNADNVKWLNQDKTDKPAPEGYFVGRYVRIYMNGNDSNKEKNHPSNHVVEIEVTGRPNLNANYGNVAQYSAVSASTAVSGDRPLRRVVDGNKTQDNYTDPGDGPHWLQLDMGAEHEVEKLIMHRYWTDTRKYHNTVILLSPDEDFNLNSTLVLWNANNDTAGRGGKAVKEWPGTGNGENQNHQLPTGNDEIYLETDKGKEFPVNRQGLTLLNGNAFSKDRFKARFVRVYMNGNTDNASNHVVEIQVMGEWGKVDMTDTTPPEKVTGIEVADVRATEATVRFLPSMDNMGLRNYEIQLQADEGEVKTFQTDYTVYRLQKLIPGTSYQVKITAVDNAGNKSAVSDAVTFTTHAENDFTVTADRESGIYEPPLVVTLNTAVADAEIYFTVDGTDPVTAEGKLSETAKKYAEAITLNASCELKTALLVGGVASRGNCYTYEIKASQEGAVKVVNIEKQEDGSFRATIQWTQPGNMTDVEDFVVKNGEKELAVVSKHATSAVLEQLTADTVYDTLMVYMRHGDGSLSKMASVPAFRTLDWVALNQAVEKAEAITDPSIYAPDRWTAFEEAKKAAKAVKEKHDATQADIDNALNALNTAMEQLYKKGSSVSLETPTVAQQGVEITEEQLTQINAQVDGSILNDLKKQAAIHAETVPFEDAKEQLMTGLGLNAETDAEKIAKTRIVEQVKLDKILKQYNRDGLVMALNVKSRTLISYAEDGEAVIVQGENGENTANAVVRNGSDWTAMTVQTPLTIILPLPQMFVEQSADKELWVHHTKEDGTVYDYQGSWVAVDGAGTNNAVQFVNPNGFSEFRIDTVAPEMPAAPEPEEESSPEPAATPAPQFDWMSVLFAVQTGGKDVTVDVGREIAVPHYIWQTFYGKDTTVKMQRGADVFAFNGLHLQKSGFNPDIGHNLTDLVEYIGRSYEPIAAKEPEPTQEPTTEPTAEPTAKPTAEPTAEPTVQPSAKPVDSENAQQVENASAAKEEQSGAVIWIVAITVLAAGVAAAAVVMKRRKEN